MNITYENGFTESNVPTLNGFPYCIGTIQTTNLILQLTINTNVNHPMGLKHIDISCTHKPTKGYMCLRRGFCKTFEEGKKEFEQIVKDFNEAFTIL